MPLTWVEVSRDALLDNLRQYKKLVPKAQIWPVVKSNAYGHGLKEVLEVLQPAPEAAGFMVVNLTEALIARTMTTKPIMVMSYWEKEESALATLPDHNISLPLYSRDMADYLQDLGKKINKKFLVNIKIDTGTSRLGVRAEEAVDFINYVAGQNHLQIFSVFTHLAESESEDQTFTARQIQALDNIKAKYPNYHWHCACTAAGLAQAAAQMDIVRLGLGLYGLWPSAATKERGQALGLELRPVLTWKTKIIQIKDIKKGASVGYNRTYVFDRAGRVAVLPVGYHEGYDRSLSNKGRVLIKGALCPIRGNVCMNLTMVEIPLNFKLEVGDEVGLISGDKITADWLAEQAGTINYEIVARIHPALPRALV